MSGTQGATIDTPAIDPLRAEQVAWVKANLDIDVPETRARGKTVIGATRTPQPRVDPAEAIFNKALVDNYEGLVNLRDYEHTAPKVKAAQADLAAELELMNTARDADQYGTALDHLNEAIKHRDKVSAAIDEADVPRTTFSARYNGQTSRRQRAIDLIPGNAPLLEAKEKVIAADNILQPLMDGPDFAPAERALDALVVALDALDVELGKTAVTRTKLLGDAKDGLKEIRTNALAAINAVTDTKRKAALMKEWTAFDKKVKDLDTITDEYEIGWQANKLEPTGMTLLKDALAASGADDTKRQDVFKKLLEQRFDIQITIPTGMSNTHLEKMYDMFSLVPPEHVGHDMLTKLIYSKKSADRVSGAYEGTTAEIEMGAFTGAEEDSYTIGGKKVKVNAFNVTTLHEIGHAVDEKNKIMTNNGSKAGCGGWATHTVEEVAQIYLDNFKTTTGLPPGVREAAVLAVVVDTLKTGKRTWPPRFTDDQRNALRPLLQSCQAITEDNDPWEKVAAIGTRSYHQSYSWEWVSYEVSARSSTLVNKYQWRSHSEWFAELYAVTWLKKQEPPSAVDKAAANYMWGGAYVGTR